MSRTGKVAWLPLSLVAVVALAVLGLFAATNTAQAGVTSLSVGSATVAPGAEVDISLSAVATTPGIGAYEVKVAYTGSLVDALSCTVGQGAAECNANYPPADTIAFFTGASSGGLTGNVNLGTIRFKAGTTLGVATLTVTIDKLNEPGGANITVAPGNGTITIAVATATPTATTTATTAPTPTKTVAKLPDTGGSTGDDSMSLAPWLLAALGLAVVGGGFWVVARTRRESL